MKRASGERVHIPVWNKRNVTENSKLANGKLANVKVAEYGKLVHGKLANVQVAENDKLANGKLANENVATDGKLANRTTFNNGGVRWLDFNQITFGGQ